MWLYVKYIATEYWIHPDFIQNYLTAKMLMAEVKSHFRDSISSNLALFELASVIFDNFVDLLSQSIEVMIAFLKPFFLAVVFELKDCRWNDSMYNGRVYCLFVGYFPVEFDIDKHGQEEQILVEGQLILHIVDFCEDLEDHESKSSEISSKFKLLCLKRQVVVLFEDQSGKGLRRYYPLNSTLKIINKSHDNVMLRLGKIKDLTQYLLVVKHSQFLLTDLMKQSEIAIRPKSNQSTNFVTYILDRVIFSNLDTFRFRTRQSEHLYLNFLCILFQLFQLFVIIHIVKEISPEFDFSCTKDRKRLSFFFFGEIRSFEAADTRTLPHTDPFFIRCASNVIEVLRKTQIIKKVFGLALYQRMVEELHEDLSDHDFSCFDNFRFMAIKPALLESFLFGNFEIILIVSLHDADHIMNTGEPHMKQFFEIQILNFDDILGILGKGSTAYFLSSNNLHVDLLPRVFSYPFEHLVHLLRCISLDILRSCSKGDEAIGVNCDHVSVDLIVLFTTRKEVLIHDDSLHEFPGFLLNHQHQIGKDDQAYIFRSRFFDQDEGKFLQELSPFNIDRLYRSELSLQLIESISSDNFVNFVIDLSQSSLEHFKAVTQILAIWMARTSAFYHRFKKHLIPSYSKSRLTELIMGHFFGQISVSFTNLAYFSDAL